jgi:threonyl-tRNA synthetase
VRGFTQDDAHIFCRPDQIETEVSNILELTTSVLKTFGFKEYAVRLSTRPEKYVGTLENWEKAQNALTGALKKINLPYEIDPGEGVFYGPKIDLKIRDCLGRYWQCSTVQVDFNLPERFKVTYRDEAGKEQQAIMVHRALLGSLERFFGILIEQYAGAFPAWLAPVQARILTITDRQNEFAQKLAADLKTRGFRVEADIRNEKIGAKKRDALMEKVPFLLTVGDREMQAGTIAVARRTGENLGVLSTSDFAALLEKEVRDRSI